ncbi:hypothetical protein [Kitasatospora sp. NPDC047058]|uniref:hypothetical protein n=1 Tax=Kitasatospora sp. NPDC047058 TaxID=3155620 RepID=UPI0033CF7ADF
MATRTSPKRPKTPNAEPAPAAPFEPVRLTSKRQSTDTEDTVTLFYIDDQAFTAPRRVSQSVTLEYLRLARTVGDMAAAQRAMERILGPDAYSAVEQSDDVGPAELEQILTAVVSLMVGQADELGKGKS